MKKVRFVQDAKLDPGRYYRNPVDIVRDRRLTNKDRLDIVVAWELGTKQRLGAGHVAAEERLLQLQRLREELEKELESPDTAAKPD